MKFNRLLNEMCNLGHMDMQAGVPDIEPTLTPYEEPEHEESEAENMIQSQLSSIVRNTQKLQMLTQKFDELEPWVQAKITLAEDYVNTIANYLEFESTKTSNKIDVERGIEIVVPVQSIPDEEMEIPPAGRIMP